MIRFGFSTLGVPGMPLRAVLDLARDTGFAGVELRCADGEPVHPGLDRAGRSAVVRAFAGSGVTPIALASYVRVAQPGPDGPVLAALRRHIWLAADIGAGCVRVFPGGGDQPGKTADAAAVRRLRGVAGLAQTCGVRLLLETHDSHRSAEAAARVVRGVGEPGAEDPGVGVLWDVLHTHLAGDSPGRAYAALAPCLGYIQVKDIRGPGDLTPVAPGTGALDLGSVLRTVVDAGYDGWLVWEYEAAWYPGIPALPALLPAARDWLERALGPATPLPADSPAGLR